MAAPASRGRPGADRVLLIAPVVDEATRRERGLPALNPSGTARVLYLARALRAAGRRTVVLAPGATWRMAWRGRVWHRARVRRMDGTVVVYAPAVGLPALGSLAELLAVTCVLVRLGRRHRGSFRGAMVYCFYNSACLAGLVACGLLRLPVVLQLEDVGQPRVADLVRRTGHSFMQELLLRVCLCVLSPVAAGVVVPSVRLARFVPRRNIEVVHGTTARRTANPPADADRDPLRINVLFGGHLGTEHGLDLLLAALALLDADGRGARLRVVVSGKGGDAALLSQRLEVWHRVEVRFAGFLTDGAFEVVLAQADVCLSLQDPSGRHADGKMPSKVFEGFLAGKAVVVTDVGDCFALPDATCLKLRDYSARVLADLLAGLTRERCREIGARARSYAAANWDPLRDGRRLDALFVGKRNAA
jgi:glycosyltransferase involved in cell wall biosynthesis